ncbi:hypothetical protein BKA62DRAFT_709415 [Auriculariales sp. MPI-PUGE-AT-0066]|nr:hypothetical protein BKA62DRAFT_709415 [Auriculariales sp. MPI-PUGE-AT-0066]
MPTLRLPRRHWIRHARRANVALAVMSHPALPMEIIQQVMEHFAVSQLPGQNLHRRTLMAAMRVCKTWYGPAASVLYRVALLRSAAALFQLVETLQQHTQLTSNVQVIKLPPQSRLLAVDAKRLEISWMARYRVTRLQKRLGKATAFLMEYCANLKGVETFLATQHLKDVASMCSETTQHMTVSRANGFYDSQFAFLDRRLGIHWLSMQGEVPPCFKSLQVLRLSSFYGIRADEAWIRDAFPKLRALIFTDCTILEQSLISIITTLGPKLKVLGLFSAFTTPISHMVRHPLQFLPKLPNNALDNIEDLRFNNFTVHEQVLRSIGLQRWTSTMSVTRLTIDPELLQKCELLPARLTCLTKLLATVETFKRGLPQWTASSPRFKSIVQRAPGCSTDDQLPLRIFCWMMSILVARWNISVETTAWFGAYVPLYGGIWA